MKKKSKSKDVFRECRGNKQEFLQHDGDKEQRRATRLGAIIAIIVALGTICTFIFKMTIHVLNVWPEQGMVYWYFQVLFLAASSTIIIIIYDIVWYVIYDLKRYNVLDQDYKDYDKESDMRYMYLLIDFRIYTIILLAIFSLSIFLLAIYGEDSQRDCAILVFCLLIISALTLIILWIKDKSKETIKSNLLNVLKKIAIEILMIIVCFLAGFMFNKDNSAIIKVNFGTDGTVEICNTSSEKYSGLDIEICDVSGIIYKDSVEKENLLIAQEDRYVNTKIDGRKVAQGITIDCELWHWKYVLDMNRIINGSGEYSISIIAHQSNRSVLLINSFLVENKDYSFAKDSMEKEY